MNVVKMTEIQTDDGDVIKVTTWESLPGVAQISVEQSSDVPRVKKAELRISGDALARVVSALGGLK